MTFRISKMLLLLLGAYFLTFMQSHWHGPRLWLGFQPDLTPALLVFVGMTMGARYISTVALATGLWLDSLSANPFGISVFPLFLVGWIVFYIREKIMTKEFMAQLYLGVIASLTVFLFQLILLGMLSVNPMIGWEIVFWSILNAFLCGVSVPLLNFMYKVFIRWFSHPPYEPNKWLNNNRQIVRGKD
ncbi:MAG: rod shape-determining protein MreD [Verrucomicrobiota bacterium]|nr:rod shape-determining protein MreD [Verrucomicrobiota bacterium]